MHFVAQSRNRPTCSLSPQLRLELISGELSRPVSLVYVAGRTQLCDAVRDLFEKYVELLCVFLTSRRIRTSSFPRADCSAEHHEDDRPGGRRHCLRALWRHSRYALADSLLPLNLEVRA